MSTLARDNLISALARDNFIQTGLGMITQTRSVMILNDQCPYVFGKHQCFGLDSEWMFAKLLLLDGKLGVMRVVTSQ